MNHVYDLVSGKPAVGRFGWKANEPTIKQQIAGAFHEDIGVTSALFPDKNCPDVPQVCRRVAPGNIPELIDSDWDALAFFLRSISVPARRNVATAGVRSGEELFGLIGCADCLVPSLQLGEQASVPILANRLIHRYTDLLLHDMGDELADDRTDLEAGPRTGERRRNGAWDSLHGEWHTRLAA